MPEEYQTLIIGPIEEPLQGIPGTQGLPGLDGAQGEPGVQGDIGPMGPRGAQGFAGERGVDGLQGEPGPRGKIGPRGKVGPRGPVGKDGRDGVDGEDGAPGADGASARDIWLKANPGKSERDFLAWMKPSMSALSTGLGGGGRGPQGAPGEDGAPGVDGDPNPRVRGVAVLTTDIAANTTVSTSTNATGELLDYSGFAFADDVELHVNGRLMRCGATSGSDFDVYAAGTASNGDFACEFNLKQGDVIQQFIGGGGVSAGSGCHITGPIPIYLQDDGSLATAAHALDLAGNCIKDLAGDILIQRGVPYTP